MFNFQHDALIDEIHRNQNNESYVETNIDRFIGKISPEFGSEVNNNKLVTLKESLYEILESKPITEQSEILQDAMFKYNYELLCDGATFQVNTT